MSKQWTDADNLSAFEQATITHQNEVIELREQVAQLLSENLMMTKEIEDDLVPQVAQLQAIISTLEWCAIRSSESESTGAIHRYYCCPVCRYDKQWGKHASDCKIDAALAALPATPQKEGK